jgi:hypothetical protein
LGFVATTDDGVIPASVYPTSATLKDAVVASGEVRWPGAVTLVSRTSAEQLLQQQVDTTLAHASQGDCVDAERTWTTGRGLFGDDDPLLDEHRPTVNRDIARCFARAGKEAGDGFYVSRALRWDPYDDEVRKLGQQVAEDRLAVADQLELVGEFEEAQSVMEEALAADPRRSWLRRRIETLRDRRLFEGEDQ